MILTLLTKDFGKVKTVLHGGRGTSKRFSAPPDIFDCGVVEVARPRASSNLYVLHSFSQKMVFETLRKDISRFTLASFCLEACDLFSLEGEPETTKFFNPLYHALNNLNKEELTLTQYSCAVIFFFLIILKIAGYNPANVQCTMYDVGAHPRVRPSHVQPDVQLGEESQETVSARGVQSEEKNMEADVKLWFSKMLEINSPILFDNTALITAAFSFLITFAENVLEKKFKTTTDLFLALRG